MSLLDKNFWKTLQFKKKSFPKIYCPTCDKGYLSPQKDTFHEFQTSLSRIAEMEPDFHPFDKTEYRFSVILKCNDSQCGDIVVCIGNGFKEGNYEVDQFGNSKEVVLQVHYPIYFFPNIKIIPIKSNYPENLVKELNASFSHFFSDLTSCANKIRICVEILMDELKVKKTYIVKGERKYLTLHKRITIYKVKNLELGNHLEAIKWIGNTGSHYDDLNIDDILDAYSIFDYCLNKIYDTHTKELKKLTKEINKKKAPLSKTKKRAK